MELRATSREGLNDLSRDPPSKLLMAFVDTVTRVRYARPRPPQWWKATALHQEPGCCLYCGADVRQAPILDPIIPVLVGGPHQSHAVALCCKGCKLSRREQDLLNWKPEAPSMLKGLRIRLALESFNHLTRDPEEMWTTDQAKVVLMRRWSQPRFHCHAAIVPEGGFIGWRCTTPVPIDVQLKLALEHHAGRFHPATRCARRDWSNHVVYWFPSQRRAIDAVWDVIEHNGLIRSVEVSVPLPTDGKPDPSSKWKFMSPTITNLVRQRTTRD